MATRKSPLSLKARAIALLAQREHSVAELRRKLLRLAELRDLEAWQLAHEPADRASPGHRPFSDPQSEAPVSARHDHHAARPDSPPPGRGEIGSFDLDEDWEAGELEAFLEEWGGENVPQRRDTRARSVTATTPAARVDGGDDDAGSVRRVSGRSTRSRPALPSAAALSAVMDAQGRQARAEEVEQLLQWLQQRSYLSEARLVESRINARASRYGNLRIQQELRQLGVAPDEEQQARLKDSELDRAREVWQRKFGGEMPTDAASRARQMRFLATRGFSSDVVRRVLRGDDD